MDLDGLFWIALIVFYFVARALGGKRKPSGAPPQDARRRRGQTTRPRDDELDAALDEIRQALGFPASDAETPTSTAEKMPRTPERGRSEQATRPPRHEPPPAVRRDEEVRRPAPAGRTDGRERPASPPTVRAERRSSPGPTETIVPELPPLQASFSEEEAFERRGRHPHDTTRPDFHVVSPYEAPQRNQLPSVMRRLAGRSSLREAFLLKEILDRPISLRRR